MIKTLIADDSKTVCSIVSQVLKSDGRFEVCGTAFNGKEAVELNRSTNPDLIIMDLNMPVMNGIGATRIIMSESTPAVIAFSTEDAASVGYECIEAGALEMIPKPDFLEENDSFMKDFLDRLSLIAQMHMKVLPARKALQKNAQHGEKYELLVIGSSTGGPSAVQRLLSGLKKDFPVPVLITQHIDAFFDVQFVNWLNQTTELKVQLAEDLTFPEKGNVYVAPADRHLTVERSGDTDGKPVLRLSDAAPVHFLKPAVDMLFKTASQVYREKLMAVLLTGMGRDGAEGCVQIVKNGGYTIAEAEESCVVFGMPKAAIDEGGAKSVLPLEDIAGFLNTKIRGL